jgi:hypothetical protein
VIDGLDGHRTMNLVDALLQNDALLGQHLDDDGLNKIRAHIIRAYQTTPSGAGDGSVDRLPEGVPGGLASGKVLGEISDDEDSPFGLSEAPLG